MLKKLSNLDAADGKWSRVGNNVLKNHGYNLEHNFGHGQNHLCELFLSLNKLTLFYFILF